MNKKMGSFVRCDDVDNAISQYIKREVLPKMSDPQPQKPLKQGK
jgi:hypothetical protein